MRSPAQRRSSSSVVVRSADRDLIETAVRRHSKVLRREHPEICRIIWFGSWISGAPTPGSDVDLCIVLADSDRVFRDRIPDYLPNGFPVGVDVFPYTSEEFERLAREHPGWYAEIAKGRDL
jgi:uncharacterized protein